MIWLWTALGVSGGLCAILALIWMIGQAADHVDPRWKLAYATGAFALVATMCTVLIVAVIQDAADEEDQGPCLHESTGQRWNPATKTVQPYTYCDQRGTWTK